MQIVMNQALVVCTIFIAEAIKVETWLMSLGTINVVAASLATFP